MHWYNYLVTIILSGFIGWGITWMIIKMMFYPRRPVNIFGYKLQGIFPKNQPVIAEILGEMVSTELLPFTDIEQKITSAENLEKLKDPGRPFTAADHPLIRDEEACYNSSLYAIQIARKYDTRLHILHITDTFHLYVVVLMVVNRV